MILGVLVFTVLLAIWLGGIYNKLVTARNDARHAFAQIDVQLTRRHELVPDIVAVAKAHLQSERGMLEALMQARNAAVDRLKAAAADPANAVAVGQLSTAENQLSSALGRALMLIDHSPAPGANARLAQLSEELATTETRVESARQAYNETVMRYNNAREIFPNNFVAGNFNFSPMQIIEIQGAGAREVPKVSLS